MSERALALGAFAAVLTATGCLPRYEYISDGAGAGASTATGTGTAGGGGGAGGGQVDTCVGSPAGAASEGPYGTAKLYFGVPELLTTIVPPAIFDGGGAVSPDGLRFMRRWTNQLVIENKRADPFADWGPNSSPQFGFYDLYPHLTEDNLRVFSCHGGEGKCVLHERPDVDSPFEFLHYFVDFAPFDGAAQDLCFTPTPDRVHLAFCSTRKGFDDDSPGQMNKDLWVAQTSVPGEPTSGYTSLARLDEASAELWDDEPTWFDDEALTLVFHSTRDGTDDLYVTTRPTLADPFGPAQKIVALSTFDFDERHFTLPSMKTLLETPCGAGFGYFQKFNDMYRVPVCVGAPCE